MVLKNAGNTLGTMELPFSNLTYGKCIQDDERLTFIMSSAEGTTFIASFNNANWSIIEILNGISRNGDSDMRKHVFSSDKKVFAAFDSVADNLVIVNLTHPLNFVNVSAASFKPELISISKEREFTAAREL